MVSYNLDDLGDFACEVGDILGLADLDQCFEQYLAMFGDMLFPK